MHVRWYFLVKLIFYIFHPWNPWILETPNPLKAPVNMGKPSIPWNPEALGPLVPLKPFSPWGPLTLGPRDPKTLEIVKTFDSLDLWSYEPRRNPCTPSTLTPIGSITLKVDHPRRSLGAGWDLPYSFTKTSFRGKTWQQTKLRSVLCGFRFESLDNFEKWQLLSWARRDYVVILGYNCPSSSRWS